MQIDYLIDSNEIAWIVGHLGSLRSVRHGDIFNHAEIHASFGPITTIAIGHPSFIAIVAKHGRTPLVQSFVGSRTAFVAWVMTLPDDLRPEIWDEWHEAIPHPSGYLQLCPLLLPDHANEVQPDDVMFVVGEDGQGRYLRL